MLLGHAFGTVLGTFYVSQHPEKVVAYVGVSQIADTPEGYRLSQAFALSEARERSNTKAIAELEKIGPRPRSVDDMLALGTWVEQFGGMFRGDLSTGRLIWSALRTDEANLVDLVKFGQGNRFSLTQLWDEFSVMKLSDRYVAFKVPVFFLLGRYDRHVPSELAARYFEKIEAPCKRLVWFEHSAHNPPFEESDRFNRVLIEEVRPWAEGVGRCAGSGSGLTDSSVLAGSFG